LDNALHASGERLSRALGEDSDLANFLAGARSLVEGSALEQVKSGPVSIDDEALIVFLKRRLHSPRQERFLAIFVDRDCNFLADEVLANSSPQSMRIELRKLFGRALDLNASGFLLAHNHPSGLAVPSKADQSATRTIAQVASALKLMFIDHIVVTKSQAFSMRRGAFL
jgi:DNA repair protein RadC